MKTHDLSFVDHVTYLSSQLRKKYDLVVKEDDSKTVVLENRLVKLRFFPGVPRDPYVEMTIAYTDTGILGTEKYFELWRYIDFLGAWDFFPVKWPEGNANLAPTHDPNYSYIGSPFEILEIVVFLTVHGDHILKGDQEKIKAFLNWKDQKDREYNKEICKRSK